MGGYNDLKTAITALIRTNDNQEITGATLQSALLSIINTIGQGSVFKGVATTSTNPGSPDADVFYIAGRPGYYPNFNLELTAGLHVIENKSGAWVNTEIQLDVVDAINIGGAKHVKPSQAMIVALQSVEQIPDSEGLANKMWWSTDGHLKYRHNNDVYDLGNPAYVLYYCGDKIYKWTGSGFREIGGGGTFASGEAVSNMSIFDDGSDTDGKSSAQLAAMIPSGEVIKSLLEIISSIETSGGSYDGVDLITTFSYDAPTRVITVKQSGRQAKTILLPLANSANAGLMSSEDKITLANVQNLIGKTVNSFSKSTGETGITITLVTTDGTPRAVLIPIDSELSSESTSNLVTGAAIYNFLMTGFVYLDQDNRAYAPYTRILPLVSMGSALDDGNTPAQINTDEFRYDPTTKRIYRHNTSSAQPFFLPGTSQIYLNICTGKMYKWTGSDMEEISGEVDSAILAGKADKLSDSDMLTPSQWPRVMLYNIESMWGAGGTPPDYASIPVGSIYLDEPDSIDNPPYKRLFYKKTIEGTSQRIDLGAPQENTIYCHIATGKLYRWIPTQNGNDGAFQQIGGSGTVTGVSVNSGQVNTPDQSGVINLEIPTGGTAEQEISILFVGNSLTQDAVSYLPLVLKELAPNLVFKFYIWYDGGYTLTQILNKWNNNSAAEIFSTCENVTSWTNANNTQKMGAFLSSGKTFDIVCLQEYFNYKRESGYTAADKQVFNDAIAYIRTNYNKPFKVVSYFHRPLCKNPSTNVADLSIADEVFGLTYDGVRWQLENTISEGVIPTGIAAYRALYDSILNSLGTFGYMSYEGTHSQEGLPCLMQAWVVALWILDHLGLPLSINNAQQRVTSANYSSINVPGPNGSVVVGTDAQDKDAMDVAIKAFKEGKMLEQKFISARGIPAYKIVINGASGDKAERNVQLSASLLPADADVAGVTWSIVSGDATINNAGLLTYNGSSQTASVVVRATLINGNLKAEATISFVLAAVETPTFSPVAGTYATGQAIAINCATSGAIIYYTTDNSTPTALSNVYSSPISLNASMTIKAIAIKNGESSNVASAEYVAATPRSVTINVSNGSMAVVGATVTLTKNGVVFQPESSSQGSYIFNVVDGTYTINAIKNNMEYHGELIVNSDITISIVLEESSLDVLQDGAIVSPRLNLYGTAGQTNPAYQAVNGCSLITYNSGNRSCLLALRSETSHPCTWNSASNAPNADKELYTLYEINQEYPYIEISINEPYSFVVKLSDSDPDNGYWYNPYDSAWVTRASLVLTPQSNPVYLTLQLRTGNNTAFSGVPTIEQMGLSIKAYKANPNS